MYDSYRENGVKHGPSQNPFEDGHYQPRRAEDVFEQFFKRGSPFSFGGFTFNPFFVPHPRHHHPFKRANSFFGEDMDDFGMNGYSSRPYRPDPPKLPPIQLSLKCTLEELYSGRVRQIKVSKEVTDASGKAIQQEKTLSINVEPGWVNGTKITFEKEGNERLGMVTSDIVVVVEEIPHERFQREHHNLVLPINITLEQALVGISVSITTLDLRILSMEINEIMAPGTTRVIYGEGMPDPKRPGQRGDMIFIFNVSFPKSLTRFEKDGIRTVLSNVQY